MKANRQEQTRLSGIPLPLKLGAIFGVSVFLIEMSIMLFGFLPAGRWGAMADAGLLTIFACPVLYFALVRPLAWQIRGRDAAQRELLEYQAELEDRVEERTRGLKDSVEALKQEMDERRRAEAGLEASEERLRVALEAAKLGTWDYRFDTGQVFWDECCRDQWGVPEGTQLAYGEVIGTIHSEDRAATDEEVTRALAGLTDGAYRREFRVLWPDGSIHWIASHGTVYFDGEGDARRAIRFVGVNQDTTERKQAEEALRQSEEELRQSHKMEAVGQLAGGIAHDFNNLLTAILGYSNLILASGEGIGESQRGDVEEIKAAADRASALTRQILAFSRRQALHPERVSLNEIVAGTERLLARTLGEHIDLVTLLDPEPGLVEVDRHQFEQVLLNLALNARDAMPSGGRLTLETANVELDGDYCRIHMGTKPGAYVMLAVSDTGTGMDEETKSRVFEPFFTTKEPGKGTGLGLATLYGTVKQSGGGVFVYSELGKGTTFKVYLPRVSEPAKKHAAAASAPDSLSGCETILVVEDEVAVQELVKRALRGLGYTILAAGSGDEGLALLEGADSPVDLLLTDVVLPGSLQGNELAQTALALHPHLPVLYMSGYARDAIVHSGRLDGGVNYIEKPFAPDGLAHRVREVLDCHVSACPGERLPIPEPA